MTDPGHIKPSPVSIAVEEGALRSWIEAMRSICAPTSPFRFDQAEMMAHIIRQNAMLAAEIGQQMIDAGRIIDVVPPEIKLWEKQ